MSEDTDDAPLPRGNPWPKLTRGPQLSLEVSGVTLVVDAWPARVWVRALATMDGAEIFPALLRPEDRQAGLDVLLGNAEKGIVPIDGRQHGAIVLAIISHIAGVPYRGLSFLLSTAESNWDSLDGMCAMRGVDPLELPLHRFAALVFSRLVSGADDKKRAEIEALVYGPFAEDAEENPEALSQAESDSFMRSMLGAGKPA